MRKHLGILSSLVALLALSIASAPPAISRGRTPKTASALGVASVDGRDVFVDVLVAVPAGADPRATAERALEEQGARPVPAPLGSGGFAATGLSWPGGAVTQHYNPTDQPDAAAETAFANAAARWNAVTTSGFTATIGDDTSRCPSLVKECPGFQVTDGANDVGWLRIGGLTLGVTWFVTEPPEADMAMNTRFAWSFTCADEAGTVDSESVFVHEEGHVVGLDHSQDSGAVMSTPYDAAQCALSQDDVEGATYLYPTQTATVSGTVTDGATGDPIAGATVQLAGTSLATTTDAAGAYSIAGVPYPVTYDVAASMKRYRSAAERVTVDVDPETVDLVLAARGGGGGGPPF